tara:strand:- start:16716 stop:17225 length:510 start_codon:yes stop_codon:yes gene_type:complete
VPSFWQEQGTWAIPAIAAAGILGILLLIWIIKRLCRPKIISPLHRYRAESAAMKKLISDGHTEEIPARLSRVLRETIEAITGIRAPEQTTEEFLSHIGSSESTEEDRPKIPAEAVGDLKTFLSLMDEAKYARRQLDLKENQKLLDTADHFVEQTVPAMAQPNTKPEGDL